MYKNVLVYITLYKKMQNVNIDSGIAKHFWMIVF